ncbi:MAG: 4-hydroxyacetophenone monooxygenase, partial [Rhodospirillales bacterium]|nr:4-hydroxyacetophenone monooxygenase [Rhodospirillales bacterium]
MLYGPNTNTAASIVFMLESQVRYIMSCLAGLAKKNARFMQPLPQVQKEYNEEIQRRLARTVLVDPTARSYFKTAPGKVTTQWPGFLMEYRLRT